MEENNDGLFYQTVQEIGVPRLSIEQIKTYLNEEVDDTTALEISDTLRQLSVIAYKLINDLK